MTGREAASRANSIYARMKSNDINAIEGLRLLDKLFPCFDSETQFSKYEDLAEFVRSNPELASERGYRS